MPRLEPGLAQRTTSLACSADQLHHETIGISNSNYLLVKYQKCNNKINDTYLIYKTDIFKQRINNIAESDMTKQFIIKIKMVTENTNIVFKGTSMFTTGGTFSYTNYARLGKSMKR